MPEIFFCKQCGRAQRAETKPNWCYFDRSDSIENVSDGDAKKMGLLDFDRFEFPGDVVWDPFTGKRMPGLEGGTLRDFQRQVMGGVRA